ncbi:MAG TPA: hypothetical protein VNC60_00785 [Actinomycetota bacterium]|nr:hypothetical protein [Actinomycetota bacterium]
MDRIPIGEQPKDTSNVVRLPGTEEAMSYEDAVAADAAVARDGVAPPEPPPLPPAAELVEQGVRVAAGMFAAGATALAEGLRSTLPDHLGEAGSDRSDPVAGLAGAALGAAVIAAEAAAGAAEQLAATIGPAMSWIAEPLAAAEASELAAGVVRVLDGRWKASQTETIEAAAMFLGAAVPAAMKTVGDRIDLTALLREHLDVNAMLADVDVARIAERLDLDALVSRIDLEALAERIARKVADAEGASPDPA